VTFRSSVNPAKLAGKVTTRRCLGRSGARCSVMCGRVVQSSALRYAIVDDMVAPNSGVLNDSPQWHAS
jgi:hypothetical protein